MRYEDVLPPHVAERQRQWERRHAILRAIEAGAKMREIAAILGIGKERVRTLEANALRDIRNKKIAPIKHYFNDKSDVFKLAS